MAMKVRVAAARPEHAGAFEMHATAHWLRGDWSAASKSYMKAGKIYGDEGDAERKATCLENARRFLEQLR